MFDSDNDVIEYARDVFRENTREHQMKIFHNHGVYRHLHFYREGDDNWSWDIITWPNHLAISGHVGEPLIFHQQNDMFIEFFHGDDEKIPFTYWAEKSQRFPHELRQYSPEIFLKKVREYFETCPFDKPSENEEDDWIWDTDSMYEELLAKAESIADYEALAYHFVHENGMDEPIFDIWRKSFINSCLAIAFSVKCYKLYLYNQPAKDNQ